MLDSLLPVGASLWIEANSAPSQESLTSSFAELARARTKLVQLPELTLVPNPFASPQLARVILNLPSGITLECQLDKCCRKKREGKWSAQLK
jgi:hypothetical protein